MKMKKAFILLVIQLIYGCMLYSQLNVLSVKKTTKVENNKIMINMGIQNIPDIYYDYYYTFPVNIEEMCSFIENHFDYKNDSSKIWKDAIQYLRANKGRIKIISNNSMFVIYEREKISYNKKNICSIFSMHFPEVEYLERRNDVIFFNSNKRNIREIMGSNVVDTIKTVFRKQINNMLINNTAEFKVSENKRYIFDQFDRMLLEYTIKDGLHTFCQNETMKIFNEKYLKELNILCKDFCNLYDVDRIIFSSYVII
jgi:hypothetical protein